MPPSPGRGNDSRQNGPFGRRSAIPAPSASLGVTVTRYSNPGQKLMQGKRIVSSLYLYPGQTSAETSSGFCGVPSEFGQHSTLRRLRVNSINNLQEKPLHKERQVTRPNKWFVFCIYRSLPYYIVRILRRPHFENEHVPAE